MYFEINLGSDDFTEKVVNAFLYGEKFSVYLFAMVLEWLG
jgi:hypothetical protein